MADPRSLFGELRLPEFLGGRQVDRYIPPEVRQGVGALVAGLDMLNPVTAYRDYMSAARRGDYGEAGVNLAGFVAPGVASGLASRAARPVVRAARGAVSSADEGARALMEMLSPVGAVDDLADQAYGEMLDQSLGDLPALRADDFYAPADTTPDELEEMLRAWEEDINLLNEQFNANRLLPISDEVVDQQLQIVQQLRNIGGPLTPEQLAILDTYENVPTLADMDLDDALMDDLLADDELVPSVGGRYGYSALNPNPDANEARFYSPAQRAAEQLPQQVYGGLDEVLAALRAKGAKPEELRLAEEALYGATELGSQGSQRMFRESAQGVLRDAEEDYTPRVARFTGNRTDFEGYFTKGGEGYTEVIMGAPPALRRNLNFSPPDVAGKHFDVPGGALAHYRAARFRTSGAEPDAYHVGEIQSDWGQLRSSLPKNQEDYDSTLGTLQARIRNLEAERRAIKASYRDSSDAFFDESIQAKERMILKELSDVRDKLNEVTGRYNVYGTREDFDEKYADVPYIKSTDKWTQLALKQALIDAANSGSRFMTLGTGEMAKSMTGGELGGQTKYYDEVVPKNLKQILQRLASDAGIKAPEIVPREIQVRERGATVTKTVPSIELTPELRKALSEVGLPSYRDGGLVSLLPV
jgi:hypothetical protein